MNIRIWQRWERILLSIFIAGRIGIFVSRFGESWGFDAGSHLWMLHLLKWNEPIVGIRESFFSYHPPLAFLLPRSLMLMGLSDVVSVQIVSFSASLIAFFFLRETLKHLRILWHPVPIAFLYITSGMPLQVYMSASINFDVFIIAYASAVLYLSVRLFWNDQDRPIPRIRLACAILATLSLAMLTKFNGIILCAIPPLVALFRQPAANYSIRNLFYRVSAASLLGIFSLAIVSPYYINRYYKEEGVLLPSNNDGWIEEYRVERNKDRLTFVRNQLFAPIANAQGTALENFDFEGIRLFETWNGLWARTTWYRAQSPSSVAISKVYQRYMPFLLAVGLCIMIRRITKKHNAWLRLSFVMIVFALITLSSSLYFVYNYPYAPWHPAKTIYASSLVFGIGAILAYLLYIPRLCHVFLGLVAVFMIINHIVPVY